MDKLYLYGNNERLFLNTNLGCLSNCSFCYLPDLSISKNGYNNQKISIINLIDKLKNNSYFIKGQNGTILSIGCYSECWDKSNKMDTISLVNNLLEFNNPIQLSTKKKITKKDLETINLSQIKYKGQLSIYISNSSITKYKEYEDKTTKPSIRFKSFDLINEFPLINFYLYIKPVIKDITIQDKIKYINLIKKYNLDVIIGEYFESDQEEKAPIGNGILGYSKKENDTETLKNIFSKFCNVYKYSIEPIKKEQNGII
ncbi:hypothetical protein ACOTVK_01765 [Aliarcobacter butzleri]|uniref:hypothetical protein n=1 Tax=Aliarcobacter butzleri TaxID=28197 RepID=UPI00344EDB9C